MDNVFILLKIKQYRNIIQYINTLQKKHWKLCSKN